ncbi:Hypothetical_protein [Hexamita inflata]|uniref:Hypothetical_protein n=1 Tax=Hexamita inflata TaxID=28002 RepID=A0AA86QPS5_9EUKA|nr:Hypothetical protein HINF_LOCUS43390 [Hexamita inflata]
MSSISIVTARAMSPLYISGRSSSVRFSHCSRVFIKLTYVVLNTLFRVLIAILSIKLPPNMFTSNLASLQTKQLSLFPLEKSKSNNWYLFPFKYCSKYSGTPSSFTW